MNKIQEHQLQMALEVDRICKKYNIDYTLDGGTLLGAIRHKGFIPWDDDLDINMLRKDFNKFIKVAQKELGNKYFLQTVDTDAYYGNMTAKIRENNTTYIEELAKNVKAHNGIYIDIFPVDNAPDNKFKAKFLLKKYIFLRMLLLIKSNYTIDNSTFIKKVCILILKIMSKVVSKKYIIKKLRKIEKKYMNKDTNKYVVYNTVYFNKGFYDKDVYDGYIKVNFEKHSLSAIKNYDKYLNSLYGDYMTPPPENERGDRHKIIECKLNNKK